jgi:hypothetical protein
LVINAVFTFTPIIKSGLQALLLLPSRWALGHLIVQTGLLQLLPKAKDTIDEKLDTNAQQDETHDSA